jgi:choline kinase
MKAIILSAGQGRRLLPLTESSPKCLLPVHGQRSVLEVQLRTLAACGVEEATVMVGFGADEVDDALARYPVPGLRVDTFYNPFYKIADNLITVWLASSLMTEDFILLNGDTLFDAPVLDRLLAAPDAPLTIAINQKSDYDDDDMKVSLNGGRRLRAVGKTLDPSVVDGESIGLMLFRDQGVATLREALSAAIRDPSSLSAWYLSVVNELADNMRIETADISGLWWGEIDCPEDLIAVRAFFDERQRKREVRAFERPGAS